MGKRLDWNKAGKSNAEPRPPRMWHAYDTYEGMQRVKRRTPGSWVPPLSDDEQAKAVEEYLAKHGKEE